MSGIIKPTVGAQLKLDHPLSRGLVGCWLLNENNGNKVHDYSGQGNLGTLTNMDPATDWVGSLHGGALDFDGYNDYLAIPIITTSTTTLSAWIKTSSGTLQIVFMGMTENNQFRIHADGNLRFLTNAAEDINIITTGVNVIDGKWHHIVAVNNGTNAYIYLDGIQKTSGAGSLNSRSWDRIGEYIELGWYGFLGCIDEFRIYNRALSAQEIAWLYAFPYAMFEEESPYWILKAAGGGTYNEAVTFSSTPACSHSPQADLLGSVAFASTPALSPAGIADLLGAVTMSSNPAVSMAHVLDIFPSLVLASDPALTASALADFYSSLTLASTPAAVMAAVADLIASLALASDPAFAVVGGSDFYESLALSSSPALSNAVFKEAFGELSLASTPALSASALADLYAAITMATSGGISTAALADFFIGLTLSSIPALSALGQIAGEVIQKMVMESIGVREKLLRTKKQEADGDIDIRNLILTNPYDEIAPVSTTWERTEKLKKDA